MSFQIFLIQLGVDVALFLNRLNYKGVAYSTVHIIGFSLGANVASRAGKYTIWNYGNYIARWRYQIDSFNDKN